jgi:hypothetical protein
MERAQLINKISVISKEVTGRRMSPDPETSIEDLKGIFNGYCRRLLEKQYVKHEPQAEVHRMNDAELEHRMPRKKWKFIK